MDTSGKIDPDTPTESCFYRTIIYPSLVVGPTAFDHECLNQTGMLDSISRTECSPNVTLNLRQSSWSGNKFLRPFFSWIETTRLIPKTIISPVMKIHSWLEDTHHEISEITGSCFRHHEFLEFFISGGTQVGLRGQFSCQICLFLGTRLANFSSDTKFSLLWP